MNTDDDYHVELTQSIALIQNDLEETANFISRLMAVREGLRAISFSIAAVTIGLILTEAAPGVAIIGFIAAIFFGLLDAENWSHFDDARRRAGDMERLLQSYHELLFETTPVRTQLRENLLERLEVHQYGVNRNIHPVGFRHLLAMFFRRPLLYPGAALLIGAFGLYAWATNHETQDHCLLLQNNSVVEVSELPRIIDGQAVLVECPP